MTNYFIEEQKYKQWWVWLILLGTGVLSGYGIHQQVFLEKDFGSRPLSNLGLSILLGLVIILIILFRIIRLRTEVNSNEILVEFYPFTTRVLKWEDVDTANVIDYGFLGGWGIFPFSKNGSVYNISGSKGLQVKLLNGKRLLVGTKKPKELSQTLKTLGHNYNTVSH